MSKQQFETNKTPHIHVSRCQGDLLISGRMGEAVDISGASFSAEMSQVNQISVASEDELDVRVPSDSSLTLDHVDGHVIIRHVTGHLTLREASSEVQLKNLCSVAIHSVEGPLVGQNVDGPITIVAASEIVELRNVGALQIERAGSDLRLHYVTGNVDIGQIQGNLEVHTVSGDLSVAKIHGDAQLSNLGGHNSLPDVAGEIRLAGSLASGEHAFVAAGNIIVRWPFDAPISLIANASKVRCLLSLENRLERLDDNQFTTLTGHIEEGQAILSLKTPAQIGIMATYVSGAEPPEPADFAFDFKAALAPQPAEPGLADAADEPSSPSSLSEQLSDAITARLRQAGLEMNPIHLKQLVSSAVATTLLDRPDVLASTTSADDLGWRPSPGQIAAESARQAVESSLRQAKESLERVRRQGQPATKKAGRVAPRSEVAKKHPPLARNEQMVTEEQLNILDLLQAGHITATQAKTLLDSLEK